MAQKRMFSKSITNSSRFLMMPQSSQNLYFHLGMNADDDGFCEHFTIMRMTDSKPDDLKILQGKGFVHVFDDQVLIVRDWKENNYLRSDRYTASKYLDIYKEELQLLSETSILIGIPDVNQLDNQIRLDKNSIDKIREEEIREEKNIKDADIIQESEEKPEKEKSKRYKYSIPSDIDTIKQIITENNYNLVNANEFYYHYESNGWMVGRNKMKCLKSTIAKWHHSNMKNPKKPERPKDPWKAL